MESSESTQAQSQPQAAPQDSVVSLLAWLEVNKMRLAIGGGIALVVIFVSMIVIQQQAEKERTASAALSDVRMPYSASGTLPPGTADALAKVAAEHAGTQAAARALLLSAGVLFSEAKSPADYAAAEKRFAQIVAEYPESQWVPNANLGIAASLKAQGKTAEATAKYEEITKRFASSPVIAETKLALAKLYETSKSEEAFKMYEDLMKENPNSVLSMEATMRQDDLLKAKPELAKLKQPATPPMTVTPTPPQQPNVTPMTNRAAGATSATTQPVQIKLNSQTPTPGAPNAPAAPAK
jgi:TolA-binding protein